MAHLKELSLKFGQQDTGIFCLLKSAIFRGESHTCKLFLVHYFNYLRKEHILT